MKCRSQLLQMVCPVLVLLNLTSCERSSRMLTTRWHGQGPVPAGPSEGRQDKAVPLSAGADQIYFENQKLEGVPVQGAFFKRLEKEGRPLFVASRWMSGTQSSWKRLIQKMRASEGQVRARVETLFPGYRQMKWLSGPDLVIETKPKIQPVWRMLFELKNGELIALTVDEKLRLLDSRREGSQFGEAMAFLFPKGPLRSEISNVKLNEALTALHLESDRVLLRTEADVEATAEKNQFHYSSDDLRFSQVQAYYFVSESMQWFEKNFQLKMPFRVEVETQKGFPGKTNTAFYYQHRIRLGEGDEISYSRIPLDPSIVIHESIHAVNEAVSALPYEGEGGSLNEAYADFWTAMQLDNPRLGEVSYRKEPFKRSLENDLKLSQKNGGLYHDSLIVSGLLWNIRTELGPEVARRVAWKTLLRLTPDSDFAIWLDEFSRVLSEEPAEIQNKIRGIVKNRGWNEIEQTKEEPKNEKENL